MPLFTNDGLYGTSDDGVTWASVGLQGRQVNAVKENGGTTVYAGVGDQWNGDTKGGVFRKRGTGDWTQVGPADAVIQDMAVDPRDPKHIYIGVGAGAGPHDDPPYGVFESPDGGDNWTQVLTTPTNIWTLAIDPQNPDTLYTATMDTIYQSLNSGAKWEVYSQGGAATNIQSLFMPSLPPTPVMSFTVVAVDSATNRLSWTNPLDVGFTDTMIRYSTVTYPVTYDDGILLTKRAAKPGSSDSTDHNGVESGKTYYYSAFASDFLGRFSAPRNDLAPKNVYQSAVGVPTAVPILRGGTSVLYLSTNTGLYRRTVDDPSGFRIYLPLLLKAAP
jgi:hypothetical protein